jgi:isoquinoline 1-oxidoreductase beta subunit
MSDIDKKSGAWRQNRRGFLVKTGIGLGVLGLGAYLSKGLVRLKIAEMVDNASASYNNDQGPTVWFEIKEDNTVIFHNSKVEMGQGIHTALGQIVVEELGIQWNQLRVVAASTDHGPTDPRATGGSDSVSSLWEPLRELAAEMREMLVNSAATLLKVAPSSLSVTNGVVKAANGKSMTFGEIVKQTTTWESPKEKPTLRTKDSFQFIGKSMPRVDIEDKVKGRPIYGIDGMFPNMLYGAIAFPTVVGARFKSAKPGKAGEVPGVVKVVIEDDFAAVIARNRTAAEKGKEALEVEWDIPKRWTQRELTAMLKVGEGDDVVIQDEGSAESLLDSPEIIRSEYSTPMAAHAQLEPNGAVVWVQPNRVDVLISTQVAKITRSEVAKALGMEEEQVNIQPMYVGGGFGRRLHSPHAVQVARLSQAVGRPVHCFSERKEEFQNGYLRPPTNHLLKARLTDGKVEAFEHNVSSGDVAFPSPMFPSWVVPIVGADFGAWRGGRIFYDIANKRTVSWRAQIPVYTSWWRGLGLLANSFALESFMDELAHHEQQDSFSFRVNHLGDSEASTRMKGVLQAVADATGWSTYAVPGRALGIACSTDVRTPVAQVAEVSVVDGAIKVHKITCAIDVGLAINPDGIRAQCEGAIMMALSSALKEGLYVDENGELGPTMYGSYPMLTLREAPVVEVIILETGNSPRGVGEPPMGPVAPAVSNAVYKLTGKRLRDLPLKLV